MAFDRPVLGDTEWYEEINAYMDDVEGAISQLGTDVAAALECCVGSDVTALPAKTVGEYFPKYQSTQDLLSIPSTVNLVYLFQAGPAAADASTYPTGSGAVVLIGEGGSAGSFAMQPASWWHDQVQGIRGRGVVVMLSMGGAGAYVDLSTPEKAQACLDSLKAIYDQVGGYDGLDFNLETTENGLAVYPDNMVWIAQELRKAYGNKFAFSIPVAQHLTAPYIQHDIDIVTALNNAGLMNFVAPQIYDGFVDMTESQKITLVNKVCNFWSQYVGNDWTKMGVGFRTVGTSAQAMSVASSYVAFNVLAQQHPEIRGAFHFDAATDAGQSWAWANTLSPRIRSIAPPSPPPPPVSLVDDFSNATTSAGKWDFLGNAAVSGGLLTMTPTGYGTGPNSVTSKNTYNLSATSVQMKVQTTPVAVGTLSGGVTIYEAHMALKIVNPTDATKYIDVRIFAPQDPANTDLEVRYRNGTTDTEKRDYNLGYKSTDKYYRLYVQNGYLLLDAAPDIGGQPGSWSVKWLADVNDLPALNGLKIQLKVDGYGLQVSYADFGSISTSSSDASTTVTTLTATGTIYANKFASVQANVRGPHRHGLKAWNYDPATVSTGGGITHGKIYLLRLDLEMDLTISNLGVYVTTVQGATPTAGQNMLGLVSSAGGLLASAASDTLFTVGGYRSVAITPQALTAGMYYVAVLANGSGTAPSLMRGNSGAFSLNFGQVANTYSFASQLTGQTTIPSSIALASNAADASYWVGAS